MRKILWLIIIAVIIVIAVVVTKSPSSVQVSENQTQNSKETVGSQNTLVSYKNITPDELYEMMQNKDFTLIDVHIPEQKHIKGTDKFIPYNEIRMRADELPQDRNAKIVLYCRSGAMSAVAAEELIKMGYKNVYNLEGGIIAWKDRGYEI